MTRDNSRLSALEKDVFSKSCALSSSCHGQPEPESGLDLTSPLYDKTVDVEVRSGEVLVRPGEPERSYLYDKIVNPQPSRGERMPPGLPLSAADTARIRAWILAGAPDD